MGSWQRTQGDRVLRLSLRRDEIVARLRSVDWQRLPVKHVLLFGSVLKYERPEDVDIAVVPLEGADLLELHTSICEVVSEALSIPEDKVDIVFLTGDVSCYFLLDLIRNHVLLYARDVQEYMEFIVKNVKICYDFILTCERLGLDNIVIEVSRRRLGLS